MGERPVLSESDCDGVTVPGLSGPLGAHPGQRVGSHRDRTGIVTGSHRTHADLLVSPGGDESAPHMLTAAGVYFKLNAWWFAVTLNDAVDFACWGLSEEGA